MNPQILVNELRALGLTQVEIAQRIGYAQATISDVSNGKRGVTNPTYDFVTKLIALLEEVRAERETALLSSPY